MSKKKIAIITGITGQDGSYLAEFLLKKNEDDYDVRAFKSMYGKDAEFITPTNMMAVAKTMNKKFLEV